MTALEPLEALFGLDRGLAMPLPLELEKLYGALSFPTPRGLPYVISNFVTTLDGVASLGIPGKEGGGEISGNSQPDKMVMGLLRAVSDAVVVGAGTLRGSPDHLWTPGFIFPSLANEYQSLRKNLGKSECPLNVIVTARGEIDPNLPVLQNGKAPVLIVTTSVGARRLAEMKLPPAVQIGISQSKDSLSATEILSIVAQSSNAKMDLILTEGGPRIMGRFYAEDLLDEQFLTLAPQVAGRDDASKRPGLVAGKCLAPELATWGNLVSVKRSASHLFLRYAF